MGFITQMIFIFLSGIWSARIYSRKLRAKNKDWSAFLWLIFNVGTLIWGILLYFELIPIANLVNWIPWVNVGGGKDWMWNSFQIFGIDFGLIYSNSLDPIAIALFFTYPALYLLGTDGGRMLYGKRTYEEGYWWALKPIKKPEKKQI